MIFIKIRGAINMTVFHQVLILEVISKVDHYNINDLVFPS